jgi:2-polyprenyl-3-methyl-5-hydroxy-6-metoxy-1,4-benzoquinol methylase
MIRTANNRPGLTSRGDLEKLLVEADQAITPLIDAIDVDDLSRYNVAYRAYGAGKFRHFIEDERRRFLKAVTVITEDRPSGVVCDLGCFVPYLPLALSRLGYHAKIVDKYALFPEPFKRAIHHLAEAARIEVLDLDILQDDFAPLKDNDVVLLMAVVEHLNGSPRQLMEKTRSIITPGGFLLFEVPNIAELSKRLRMLLGRSPLGDYRTFLDSDYPFMGHNREMTISEVSELFARTGFRAEWIECYDYSPLDGQGVVPRLLRQVKRWLPLPDLGECIMAKARPAG